MHPVANGGSEDGGLPAEFFADVCRLGTPRSVSAELVLFREGDPAGPVLVIVGGRVKLVRTTADGREVAFGTRGAGTLIGEMAVLDGEPRSMTAVTMEATDLVEVPGPAFIGLLEERPALTLHLLRMVNRRLRLADESKISWREPDVVVRLAGHLCELLDRQDGDDLRVGHEDLAARVGVNRETVTRALGRLRSEGLIATGRGRVQVLDADGLRRRAQR